MNKAVQESEPPSESGVRRVVESLLCLAITVMLTRTFFVEGYMISTGSMAPTLVGYHRQVVCPSCEFRFARGADPAAHRETTATCPNCGQGPIELTSVPLTEGDQLLVHKHLFQWRPPLRWETVVFRNPLEPSQAFVKRVVGLPGESIQIRRGNVYINGELSRKNLTEQHAIRILVHDTQWSPSPNDEWQSRWRIGSAEGAWESRNSGFIARVQHTWSWLHYRHWVRRGATGEHATHLDQENSIDALPGGVWYDADTEQLRTRGRMSVARRDALLQRATNEPFIDAVQGLFEKANSRPIRDDYGYNGPAQRRRSDVCDLMLEVQFQAPTLEGRFCVEARDGEDRFVCMLDFDRRAVVLSDASGTDLGVRSFSGPWSEEPHTLEVSLIDRQLLAALDGVVIFDAIPLQENPSSTAVPFRVGVDGARIQLDRLRVFRDVHYTRGSARNAVDRPYTIGEDSYFMLGDNSPISGDSRSWGHGAIHRRHMVGKPFLVHLPSQPGRLRLGGLEFRLRIPDVSRIRYIY